MRTQINGPRIVGILGTLVVLLILAPNIADARPPGEPGGPPDVTEPPPPTSPPTTTTTTSPPTTAPAGPAPAPGPGTGEAPSGGGGTETCGEMGCRTHTSGAPIPTIDEVTVFSTQAEILVSVRSEDDPVESVTLYWGDGTSDTVAVSNSQPHSETSFRFRHTYAYAGYEGDRMNGDYAGRTHFGPAVATNYSGGEGNTDTAFLDILPLFNIYWSPLTLTALEDCDWHSEGDYHVYWDHGEGVQHAGEFDLGQGDSAQINSFQDWRNGLTAYEVYLRAIRVIERDFQGVFRFQGFDFHGPPAPGPRPFWEPGTHEFSTETVAFQTVTAYDDDFSNPTGEPCDVRLDYSAEVSLGFFFFTDGATQLFN